MNSKYLADNSNVLSLGTPHKKPSNRKKPRGPLLSIIGGSPRTHYNAMSSKNATERRAVPQSIVKDEQDENVNRPPDSSDDDVDPAAIVKTTFTAISEQPDWMARRATSRANAASKTSIQETVGNPRAKKQLQDDVDPEPRKQTKIRGGRASPMSSESSHSSKRKGRDEKPVLGKNMADVHGRVITKRQKKTKGFGNRAKPGKSTSEFQSPDDSDKEDSTNWIEPEADVTPKKSKKKDYITPDVGTPVGNDTFITTDDCPPATVDRPTSPNEEQTEFIMPDMDDDCFQLPDSQLSQSEAISTPLDTSQEQNFIQHDDLGLDDDIFKSARNILTENIDALANPTTVLTDYPKTSPQESRCPLCDEPVPSSSLLAFGTSMNLRTQERFCLSHRTTTAQSHWLASSYPTINWSLLDSRISTHHSFIRSLINGQESHYRSLFIDKINTGKDRNLAKTNHTPGYYGPRGLRVISENIMGEFTPLLKKRVVKDRVMSSRGLTPYVQLVLVREVATRLIMDDMDVEEGEARGILEKSSEVGDLLNEELREVVRGRKEGDGSGSEGGDSDSDG